VLTIYINSHYSNTPTRYSKVCISLLLFHIRPTLFQIFNTLSKITMPSKVAASTVVDEKIGSTDEDDDHSEILLSILRWDSGKPFLSTDQRILRLIFFSEPQLAEHLYEIPFMDPRSNGRTGSIHVFPFQALLLRNTPDVVLLKDVLDAFPRALEYRLTDLCWTPLHFACNFCTSTEIFQFLLEIAKVNVFESDECGMFPLYYLVNRSTQLNQFNVVCEILQEILSTFPDVISHAATVGEQILDLFAFCLYIGAHEQVIKIVADAWKSPECVLVPNDFFMKNQSCDFKFVTPGALIQVVEVINRSERFIWKNDEKGNMSPLLFELERKATSQFQALEVEIPYSHLVNGREFVSHFFNWIQSLSSLKELCISAIGQLSDANDRFLDELSRYLPASIHYFTLRNFTIHRRGLGSLVRKNVVSKIHLKNFRLHAEAAVDLGASLKTSTVLLDLSIDLKNVSKVCIDNILEGLTHSQSVKTLRISASLQSDDEYEFDSDLWSKLRSLESLSIHFVDDEYFSQPIKESRAICSLIHRNQNLSTFSCYYGNLDLREFARVIRSHARLKEVDIQIHSHFQSQGSVIDEKEFDGFEEIANAMQHNFKITSFNWANSEHWWRVSFCLLRNRLDINRGKKVDLETFIQLLQKCNDLDSDHHLNSEERSQIHLSLIFEVCMNSPHIWIDHCVESCIGENMCRHKRPRVESFG
jgi:hypothetical protein